MSKLEERYNIPLDWKVANPYLILKLGQIARKANESDNQWTMVKKFSTETISGNNTYQSDDELFFPMESGKGYVFRGRIFADIKTASDFKYQFTGPSVSMLRLSRWYLTAAGVGVLSVDSAFSQSAQVLVGGDSNVSIHVDGIVYPSAAGNVVFQWAQNSSVAENTSVLKGSYLEWSKI